MRRFSGLVVLAGALLMLGACTANSGAAAGAIAVRSTSDSCQLSTVEAPSGDVVFEVTNEGTEVTEFYLYDDDGVSVVGEVENIGPGITRDLAVSVSPGSYVTACKPGMVGDGIRAAFTVTE